MLWPSDTADFIKWTVNVSTMSGQRISVPCPNAAHMSIGDIKKQLAAQNPRWLFPQLCLMLPVAAPRDQQGLVHGAAAADSPVLDDHCNLHSLGLGDGAALELLVKDMEWSDSDSELLREVAECGSVADFMWRQLENHAVTVIAWALACEVHSAPWSFSH
jgi:hypothetical protein